MVPNVVQVDPQGSTVMLRGSTAREFEFGIHGHSQGVHRIDCSDENLEVYTEHLRALKDDMIVRFEDILSMQIPAWIVNPYCDVNLARPELQEELLDLASNEELESLFNGGYQKLWLRNDVGILYPSLWNIAKKFIVAFPSSYLVERAFNAVTNLITKRRNRLDIVSRGDPRLNLTTLTPDIKDLVAKYQVQPSH